MLFLKTRILFSVPFEVSNLGLDFSLSIVKCFELAWAYDKKWQLVHNRVAIIWCCYIMVLYHFVPLCPSTFKCSVHVCGNYFSFRTAICCYVEDGWILLAILRITHTQHGFENYNSIYKYCALQYLCSVIVYSCLKSTRRCVQHSLRFFSSRWFVFFGMNGN